MIDKKEAKHRECDCEGCKDLRERPWKETAEDLQKIIESDSGDSLFPKGLFDLW